MEKISSHITLKEAINSSTAKSRGIINTPNDSEFRRMNKVAEVVFEPTRKILSDRFGKSTPIKITSFFRSEALNRAVGGALRSQHRTGEAIDMKTFRPSEYKSYELGLIIIDNAIRFDQLIFEFPSKVTKDVGWIHVSYDFDGLQRNQILFAKKVKRGGRLRTMYFNVSKEQVHETLMKDLGLSDGEKL